MRRDGITTNDRQLACARINSPEGQDYLARACVRCGPRAPGVLLTAPTSSTPQAAMACAANYAWVNRSSMTFLCRQARTYVKLVWLPQSSARIQCLTDIARVNTPRRHSRRCSTARLTTLTCMSFTTCRITSPRCALGSRRAARLLATTSSCPAARRSKSTWWMDTSRHYSCIARRGWRALLLICARFEVR